jgi:hypothetical protein
MCQTSAQQGLVEFGKRNFINVSLKYKSCTKSGNGKNVTGFARACKTVKASP